MDASAERQDGGRSASEPIALASWRVGNYDRQAVGTPARAARPCIQSHNLMNAIFQMQSRTRRVPPIATALVWLVCLGVLSAQDDLPAPADSPVEVDVGGRKIRLPVPEGAKRIDGIDPEADRVTAAMLPASNRFLARFELTGGAGGDGERRDFNAQALRSLENQEIGTGTFADMKQGLKAELDKAGDAIREELAKIPGRAEDALRDVFDVDAALSVTDSAVVGYFGDSPTSLGFTMVANVVTSVGDETAEVKVVAAAMMVPVNGRLIYLYANSAYESDGDRQWAEQSVTAWRDAVVAANPQVAGPPGRPLSRGVGRSALVGGLVGGLTALLFVIFKNLKKKNQPS